ncbi:MAG: D-2-hydroxyacid dehydrogenase [Streptosporangiaceae bacterium]
MTPGAARQTGVVYEPVQAAQICTELEARGIDARLVACQSESSLGAALGAADFLVATPFPPALFSAAPRARWMQSLSAGVEAWLASPGPPPWPITRMTGLYEHYMAEYVLAHLLYRGQRLGMLAAAQSRRDWMPRDDWMKIRTCSLRGQQLGVAGLGHVGMEVARLGQAVGMRVRGLRRGQSPGQVPTSPGVVQVFGPADISRFLTGLDVLVLSLPSTKETEHLIGSPELALLSSKALVVNIARGSVIDEGALCDALVSGRLGGAILDTFEQEPLPESSPLWDLPNVTITPHMAGEASAAEVAEVCAPNIESFLRGEIPGVVVDVARGY